MAVRDGGRACYVGIASPRVRAEVPITHIVRRRISLVGSYGARLSSFSCFSLSNPKSMSPCKLKGARASKDMPELLEIAARGGVDLKSAVTRRFSLDQAQDRAQREGQFHVPLSSRDQLMHILRRCDPSGPRPVRLMLY